MGMLRVLAVALLCGCAGVRSGGAEPARSEAAAPVATPAAVAAAFSQEEIRIIREYYATHGLDQVGSKHKGKSLPPGIAKNLARGKPLPPGIAKQVLPADLLRALPRPPAGHDRVLVDGRIILIEVGTQIVRDILTDIVLG